MLDLLPTRFAFALWATCIATTVASADGARLAEDLDPIAELIRFEVHCAQWVRRNQHKILNAGPDKPGETVPWADYGFRWPAYTLAHLFATKHPDNPLVGADWCADLAMKLIDKEVSYWHFRRARGGGINTYETPHYVIAYVLEALGKRVDRERRQRWLEHEEAWVAQALVRPLGKTGRYHDSWRFTALYRLGETLEQPKWRDRGVELFQQMLALQTKEGFWVEGPGPSARYSGLMLPSLAWMYRWTGDEKFGDAARRLAKFLTTHAFYPDGISVGPFEGRDCNVMAYFPMCPGMELIPEGRAFNARAIRLWRDLGKWDDITWAAQSTRDLPRLAFYAADTCRYLSRYAPAAHQSIDRKGSLPIDSDGVLEHHTPMFDGLRYRQGPWIVALSGQDSDAARRSKSPYVLECQSRIELWHEKARLTIGGGHNHPRWPLPHANAMLDTGKAGVSDFGRLDDSQSRELRTTYYMPASVSVQVRQKVPELILKFEQGTVRYRFVIQNAQCVDIEADWEIQGVKRLCLQFPLVVWRGAGLFLDGRKQSDASYQLPERAYRPREARCSASVRTTPFDVPSTLHLPEGVPCRVHYPLRTGQFHDNIQPDDPNQGPFDLALVSCQWTDPPRTGTTRFRLLLE